MTQPIRFTIVTDDPVRAAQRMFGGVDDVPPFVRIITEARDILDLPEGTLSMARLFSRGSPAGMAFDMMRSRGMLRFPDTAFLERLDARLDRRAAARLERAGGSAHPGVTGVPAVAAASVAEPPRSPVLADGKDAPRRRGAVWK